MKTSSVRPCQFNCDNRSTRTRKKPVLLFSALAMTALLGLAAPHSALAQTPATDKSVKGQDFMNTFGVNVHFGVNNYSNTQAIADALNIIGFSRIRSTCESTSDINNWNTIASDGLNSGYFTPAGLKADVLVTGYLNDPTTFVQQQQTITTFAQQPQTVPNNYVTIETIEGPNEINNAGTGLGTHGPGDTPNPSADNNGNWYPAADNQTAYSAGPTGNYFAWSKAIHDWKITVPSLSSAKLLPPSFSDQTDYSPYPNVSSLVDFGNLHFYAGYAQQPSNFGDPNDPNYYEPDFAHDYATAQRDTTPGESLVISECGQTTSPDSSGCDYPTQAKYILNQMFDAIGTGTYRAYFYQLMDDSDGDPNNNEGAEAHFGLFDYQWHVKPAAQALANVKNLLGDTTTSFTPNVPNYGVSGVTNAGAAGSSLSVSKSDGSTYVVVWNEPKMWDQPSHSEVTAPADPVTVNFGGTYNYKVFDPLVGTSAIAAGSGSSVSINVAGSPLLVQIIPIPVTVPAAAQFVKSDTTTKGSWKGVYGADGFDIANDPSANNPTFPAYVTPTVTANGTYTWSPSNNYSSALQKTAVGSTDRIAAQWYGSPSLDVDCPITDGKTHQASFYLIDWDNAGRKETIQVLDATSGTVLNSQTLTSFNPGAYLVWNVSGHVRFHFLNAGSVSNATLSGFFFESAAPAPPAGLADGAGAAGTKRIATSWKPSAGATSYQILRATSSGGPYTQIAATTATGYTNSGLTAGTTYYYEVTASNAGGTSLPAGPVSAKAQ